MSATDRLKPSIIMTSPLGEVFTAFWVGDSKEGERKVGLFNFPDISGTFIRDFQAKGSVYSTPVIFSGPDHDLEAKRFDRALKARSSRNKSIWTIEHPVEGVLKLQPLTYSENINPIVSGDLTQFDIKWIEALDFFKQKISIVPTVRKKIGEVNSQSTEDFNRNIVFGRSAEREVFKNNFNQYVLFVSSSLNALVQKSASVNLQINSILRGISSTLNQPAIDLFSLSAQLKQLVQLPTTIEAEIFSVYNNYRDMILASFSVLDIDIAGDGVVDSKNKAAIKEHVIVSSLAAISEIIFNGEIESRQKAIELIDNISGLYSVVVGELDDTQQQFVSFLVEDQYFSQLLSFGDLLEATSGLFVYLIENIFSVKVEKRFQIDRARTPVDIVIEEYGTLGNNDQNLDEFISINRLSSNDMLLIQDNREVVVYV